MPLSQVDSLAPPSPGPSQVASDRHSNQPESALSGVSRPESVFSDSGSLNSGQLGGAPSDRLRGQRSEYRSARHTGLPETPQSNPSLHHRHLKE